MAGGGRPANIDGKAPRRVGFLIAAVVLVAVAVGAVVVAAGSDPSTIRAPVDTSNLPVLGHTPSFTAKDWLNSPPLDAGALTGKVVLYDFWTYSCINCVRTFPYVR